MGHFSLPGVSIHILRLNEWLSNNISLRFIMVVIAQSSHLLRQGLLEVPTKWVSKTKGFSGATLERPGLEDVQSDATREGGVGHE